MEALQLSSFSVFCHLVGSFSDYFFKADQPLGVGEDGEIREELRKEKVLLHYDIYYKYLEASGNEDLKASLKLM